MSARVVVSLEGNIIAEVQLTKPVTVVGRHPACDIVIDAPHVSARHMLFRVVDRTVYVEDLASTNGTIVNGERIGKWTRLWSNPPSSRPLATCIADTAGERAPTGPLANHICHSDCCSGAFWLAVSGEPRRSCYDNICDGLGMLGLDERAFQGNVNLFMSAAIDQASGDLVEGHSRAVRGDQIAFFAEVPLHVALSTCPAGAGGPPGEDRRERPRAVAVEVAATDVAPRPWSSA